MREILSEPWPWYISGPLIGLFVPLLLLIGNKPFGVSSSLRHFCAMCVPAKIPFFRYDWKKHVWNMLFVLGVFFGGTVGATLLEDEQPIQLSEATKSDLTSLGITNFEGYAPIQVFSFDNLTNASGLIFIVLGGFLVGFGTRYADGCTSGHSIFGLATLSWVSLVATVCFFIGGLLVTHLLMPYLL